MNKLFTSIAVASLSLTMAVGVGVAVSQSAKQEAAQVSAASGTATLTFTAKCGGSGTDDKGNTWTVTSDATESNFDNTKGIHYGTGSAAVSYVKLTTSQISGTITQIVVNASGASSTSAKLNAKVGTSAFGSQQSLTSTATPYTLTGSASGAIEISLTQTSAKKALYCKSISVTYETAGPAQLDSPSPVYSNGVVTWGDITNATSYKVRVDEGSWIAKTKSELSYTVDSSLASSASHKVEVVAVGDGTNYTDSSAGSVIFAKLAHAGSQADPYTVADARAAIEDTTGSITLTDKYASGIVSKVNGYYSNKYITYFISDDGTETDQLEAYNGLGIGGASFSSVDDVQVGDEVTIKGTLKLHNTTYEFDSNNQLVAQHRPGEKQLVSITVSGPMTKTSYTTDENWSKAGITVTANYDDSSTEDVTSSSTITFSPLTPTAMGIGTGQTLTINATYGVESDSTTQLVDVAAPVEVSYGRINDISSISAGDHILILGVDEDRGLAKYSSGNNIPAKAITVSSHTVSTSDLGEVAVCTIEDASAIASGTFFIHDNDGKYLYAAGTGTNNHLKSSDDSSVYSTLNGAWNISVENDGTASIIASSSNRNRMRYNPNNGNNIFSCYASDTTTGTDLAIYKEGHTPAADKVLDSLSVTGTPTKTAYTVEDSFDPTGLTVMANYTVPALYPSEDVTESVVWDALELGDTSVDGSYEFDGVTKTCTVSGITVTAVSQTVIDKNLTTDTLGFVGSQYSANDGEHTYQGETYVSYNAAKNNGIQFKNGSSNTNYIYNKAAFIGNIKTITVFMNSNNGGTISVCAGDEANPTNALSPVSTYSTKGINVYSAGSSHAFFSISSSSGACNVDRIIIELVDDASSALSGARTAAAKILSGLSGLCGDEGSGVVTQAQWEAIGTDVGTLSSDAKAILSDALRLEIGDLALSGATIENAMYHYDKVIEKFGYEDILDISDAVPANLANNSLFANVDAQTTTAIIVVVALTSVTAIGAIFFIKRRKYN